MGAKSFSSENIQPSKEVLDWLLDSDPAIRWQVRQDLLDDDAASVAAERALVPHSGWGAALLARQDPDGRWGGGLYRPKWTSTTYTLLLLHRLGLPPGNEGARRGVEALLDGAERFDGGGLTFPDSTARYPEACLTSMVVLVAASNGVSDRRVEGAVDWLLGQQLDDGGWNCESVVTGTRHGSFHTSISALEALLAYRDDGGAIAVEGAIRRGHDFFLDHRLYRSHRTGHVVDPAMTRFHFPPQWHFDVLRGLDHVRAAGATPDERLADAVALVRARRGTDGRWPYEGDVLEDDGAPGVSWFALEGPGPSRWNTLRALRVLRWWGAG